MKNIYPLWRVLKGGGGGAIPFPSSIFFQIPFPLALFRKIPVFYITSSFVFTLSFFLKLRLIATFQNNPERCPEDSRTYACSKIGKLQRFNVTRLTMSDTLLSPHQLPACRKSGIRLVSVFSLSSLVGRIMLSAVSRVASTSSSESLSLALKLSSPPVRCPGTSLTSS